MAELIPAGTTLVDSADITNAAGQSFTLYIKPGGVSSPPPSGVDYWLQHKTAAGHYVTVLVLNASNITTMGNITGIGTFRVERQASVFVTGMDIQQ